MPNLTRSSLYCYTHGVSIVLVVGRTTYYWGVVVRRGENQEESRRKQISVFAFKFLLSFQSFTTFHVMQSSLQGRRITRVSHGSGWFAGVFVVIGCGGQMCLMKSRDKGKKVCRI